MRKAVLLISLALAGNCEAAEWVDWLVRGSAFGEWVVVDRRETFIVYANTGTIRATNNIAKMWGVTDFTNDKAAPVKGVMSLKAEREYDCSQQQMRILYISRHSGNMGEGEIVGSDSNIGSWQPVMLGTVGERLWRIACGRR
ncbi:MAG: surface-adhesin E family protein [Pseudomonadota bacterium]